MTQIHAIGKELVLKADQNISLYPQQNIWVSQGTKLIFEGTVPDNFEAKLQATTVTADRDIILPDASGTITLNETLTAGSFDATLNSLTIDGTGATAVISSADDIEIDADTRVTIKDTPLKLATVSTATRDGFTASNGDMIYNTDTNKFQGYANSVWVDLH